MAEGTWQKVESPTPDVFTADDVIDAFHTGTILGERKLVERMHEAAVENMELAMRTSVSIWELLKSHGIHPHGMHLRRKSMSNFATLLLVNEEDYLSAGFEDVYGSILDILDTVNLREYHLAAYVMPYCGSFDQDQAISDGFVYTYQGK